MSFYVWNALKEQNILTQTGLRRALKASQALAQPTRRFRLQVIRNYEFNAFADYLKLRAESDGISIDTAFSDKETYYQDLLTKSEAEPADAFLVSFWPEMRPGYSEPEQMTSLYQQVCSRLRELYPGRPIFCARLPFEPPYMAKVQTQPQALSPDSLLEDLPIEAIVKQIGLEQSLDLRYLYLFRAPFTNLFQLRLAELIYPYLQAQLGIYKKVLVLDCDHTLWGGVIGEDGLEGIQLDPYEHPGNLYYAFQKQILPLHQRGIQLALCSKNNPADVLEVLEKHPHCLIKSHHLSAQRVNWESKSRNLVALAQELNLGLDSLVFVDDSPHECEEIRYMLPEIEVLTVPEQRYELPELISRSGLFEGSFDVTAINRHFSAELTRSLLNVTSEANLEAYLADLEIQLKFQPIEPEHIKRASQLTQKTNQFNLTTRRYTSAEIQAFSEADSTWIYGLWINDRHGDYGFTGLLILKAQSQQLVIDSFLLSCRVLGRKLQDTFLHAVIQDVLAQRPDLQELVGLYRPSPKNQQVADLYGRIGLRYLDTDFNQEQRFIGEAHQLNELNWELPDYIQIQKRI